MRNDVSFLVGVEGIRCATAGVPRQDRAQAIDGVPESMPRDFAIRAHLLAHKAEVRDMLLTEYNEAEAMELFREEGREEGRERAARRERSTV